ncbi:hypothetical protein HPP92_007159 [Vanilla planifolia]|uniref:AP2/ERF domain-containing protein n=1 Tax=Vanilla planifolia TaxID=51239 RepID=A0A835V8F3_VANPL|nr:hypothetical protein HPP92_007159 [Vanilla planifolia]
MGQIRGRDLETCRGRGSVWLGTFDTAEEAKWRERPSRVPMRGRHAVLNFPEDEHLYATECGGFLVEQGSDRDRVLR